MVEFAVSKTTAKRARKTTQIQPRPGLAGGVCEPYVAHTVIQIEPLRGSESFILKRLEANLISTSR